MYKCPLLFPNQHILSPVRKWCICNTSLRRRKFINSDKHILMTSQLAAIDGGSKSISQLPRPLFYNNDDDKAEHLEFFSKNISWRERGWRPAGFVGTRNNHHPWRVPNPNLPKSISNREVYTKCIYLIEKSIRNIYI